MVDCAPYLLSLGLTKSLMSLVWNVGPISGIICQPIVGVIADRSTSQWGGWSLEAVAAAVAAAVELTKRVNIGRRRPVLLFGSIIVGMALLALGWTREIVGIFIPPGEAVRASFTPRNEARV